ncbi:fatty acyl-CoA hydrolase precursor, medium chain-like [Megalops cyprinoides]|uniref:fatty acyl-CoA hydrolase precursor, medium chain-like n=1 Tax=Megalops cyprinoides TaxID=118141 RepID=UPI0018653445|nr:fatty acyl-CoA hydrolase precursor, medium chain-like [Megalops cyprinoides]
MNSVMFSVCFLLSLLFLSKTSADDKGPLVTLKYGSLRGKYTNVKGLGPAVHTYLGVPFAQPPVGHLRLAPPRPAKPWEGVRDATQQPAMCLQDRALVADLLDKVSMEMDIPAISEDCLYLNIYTPATSTADSKLPVMVWIHGGGLMLGAASSYDGSALAAYQDVVVVLIQYQLGILGFFSTGDEHVPGNLGMLDQVVALQWVQENIQSFGGDPRSVTIFGESAGGVSVSLQLLSPLSSGLFHRAIAESGTARMNMVFNPNPLPIAQIVANMSGCDITSTEKMVECMKLFTKEDILKTMEQTKDVFFGITNDGVFLTKSTEEVFQNHEVHKVPFMTGVTNQECGWLLPDFLGPPGWVEGLDREQVISVMSVFYPEPKDQQIPELITDEYLGTAEDRLANRDRLIELMGDIMFTIPAIKTAKAHRDAGAPVFLYEFQHSPSVLQRNRPDFVKSDHGDDILFVFGGCFWDGHIKMKACTEEEEQLCKTVMAYWTNFARTGSPNGAGLVEWPQYRDNEEYLGLGLVQQPGQRLKENRYIYLTQTLPEKVRALQEQGEHSEL